MPFVSIIIPARNEAANLPTLLHSLHTLDYPAYEVIVVDDHSNDGTAAVANQYGAAVISAPERPSDWAGKTWACHQGAAVAAGQYLLFTDADTAHLQDSLRNAVQYMLKNHVDLCSTPPFHRTEKWWETLLGPFHLLLLLATAPYQKPKPRRLFAIGQYLLFRREYYWKLGGHAAVRDTLAEDLAFATLSLEHGASYSVYMERPLYQVRMYNTFAEFIAGWRRIFRWGMERGSLLSTMEVVLVIFALTGFGRVFSETASLLVALLSLLAVAWIQRCWGTFSVMGVFLVPFSLFVFTMVTFLALIDRVFQRSTYWRGRAYRAGVN